MGIVMYETMLKQAGQLSLRLCKLVNLPIVSFSGGDSG
jgi:hypothetical protein